MCVLVLFIIEKITCQKHNALFITIYWLWNGWEKSNFHKRFQQSKLFLNSWGYQSVILKKLARFDVVWLRFWKLCVIHRLLRGPNWSCVSSLRSPVWNSTCRRGCRFARVYGLISMFLMNWILPNPTDFLHRYDFEGCLKPNVCGTES